MYTDFARTAFRPEPSEEEECFVSGVAELPTRYGSLRIVSFHFPEGGPDHVAIVSGKVSSGGSIRTRIHSECLTGDVFGSLRCDCRDQLQHSIDVIAQSPPGIILYLRQEGRGIGLANKVRAYALQDQGFDTVDANRALGFADDLRTYDMAASMLRAMNVGSIELMTNNPEKVRQITEAGIVVSRRVPLQLPANPHNAHYLQTKARRSGHLLDLARLRSGG